MDVLVAAAPGVPLPKVADSKRAVRVVVLMTLAAACGASWSWGHAGALSPLVLVAWWRAQTRLEALLVGAAYQLGATAGLMGAAALWLDVPVATAAALLVVVAAGVGACWALMRPARCTTWKSAGVAVLLWAGATILPFGGGAWMVGHPLVAAGWWCPGAGWVGLATMLVLFVVARFPLGTNVLVLWALGAVFWDVPLRVAPGIVGVETAAEPARDEYDFLTQYAVARDAVDRAGRETSKLVVLPEGAAGTWTEPMRELWAPFSARLAREGRSALVGAVLQGADARLENVVVGLGRAEGQVVRQRLPIPVAMWRPWAADGFVWSPWDAGVLELEGAKTGVLVCWEGALVWPALRSMAAGAESLVLLSNHGWTGPRSETRRGLEAWGALFNVPVAMAENVWRNR